MIGGIMQERDADLIIIGAGPAGLTAAQYGARANLKILVIEQMAPGGQTLLIDNLENYPGNIELKTGFDLIQDMVKQAEEFGAVIQIDAVMSLKKEGDLFILGLSSGKTLRAETVLLSTGAKYRLLDVKGEKEFYGRGVSYCATCDGPFFKGKKIFVVGGGDSACVEAEFLAKLSQEVIIVHRKDRFRAQRGLAERVLNNLNIKVRFKSRITEIKGDAKVSSVIIEDMDKGNIYEEATDAVFIFVGSIPQTALLTEAEKDESGYVITDQNMASSVPGLFVAGDVRSGSFRQVVVAAGEGATAAHNAAKYIDALHGQSYI